MQTYYPLFPVIDIVSSQIYCDYLEENQYINSCLREELREEFEEKQVYTIPSSEDEDGYGDGNVYGFRDGKGEGDAYGFGDGYGNGFGGRYGYGDGYGNGFGNGNRDDFRCRYGYED